MRTSIGFLISIVVPAFLIAGGMANSAVAQEKAAKATVKQNVIVENSRVRVYEVTYKPGAENTGVVASSARVVRALKGGTLQRIYADGKKENVVWKTGEARFIEPGPAYTTKNIGKTELRLYVVQLK
jgi:mannose-6-phosphate isomerase-like protein (cupin superfamily)